MGTSNGYSTIWLAWAANRAGGRLTSVELDPGRRAMTDETSVEPGYATAWI
jgi:predicted O-methyltransferase YrrM